MSPEAVLKESKKHAKLLIEGRPYLALRVYARDIETGYFVNMPLFKYIFA